MKLRGISSYRSYIWNPNKFHTRGGLFLNMRSLATSVHRSFMGGPNFIREPKFSSHQQKMFFTWQNFYSCDKIFLCVTKFWNYSFKNFKLLYAWKSIFPVNAYFFIDFWKLCTSLPNFWAKIFFPLYIFSILLWILVFFFPHERGGEVFDTLRLATLPYKTISVQSGR